MPVNCPFCNQQMAAGPGLPPEANQYMQLMGQQQPQQTDGLMQNIPNATPQTNAAALQAYGPIGVSRNMGRLRGQNLTGPISPNDLKILGFGQ